MLLSSLSIMSARSNWNAEAAAAAAVPGFGVVGIYLAERSGLPFALYDLSDPSMLNIN